MWIILLLITNIAIKKTATIVAIIGWVIKKRTKVRPSWIGKLAWVAVGAVTCVMIYGATIGKNSIRIENIEVVSDKIPSNFDGYKIALFSDLHAGNLSKDAALVKDMVELINGQKPDLIVQSGDIVNMVAEELNENYLSEFAKLRAVDGVVAVFGNHDLGFYIKDTSVISPKGTVDKLRNIQNNILGWHLLENENISIFKDGQYIDIAGVTYPKNLNHNNFNSENGGSDIKKSFEGLSDTTFRVFITHNPKLFDSLPDKGRADLVLSGHVHSMQMAITIFGHKISPASLMYDPFSGLSEKDGMKLYINDGMGYVLFPFRIGTRPEITIFTLKSAR